MKKVLSSVVLYLFSWYGLLCVAGILSIAISVLYSQDAHFILLYLLLAGALISGLASFTEALRGGLRGSHRAIKKKTDTESNVPTNVFSRVAAVFVVIVCGVAIGVPAVSYPMFRLIQQTSNHDPHTQEAVEQQQAATDDAPIPATPNSQQSSSPEPAPQLIPTNSYYSSTYTAPPSSKAGCQYYSDVAYSTIERPDSRMKVGQTRAIGGYNGSRKVCTDEAGSVISEDITATPIDKTIYYGTYTYEQALSDATAICLRKIPAGLHNSTFWGDCIGKELNTLW